MFFHFTKLVFVSISFFVTCFSFIECYELGKVYIYELESNLELFSAKNRSKIPVLSTSLVRLDLQLNRNNIFSLKVNEFHETGDFYIAETKKSIVENSIEFKLNRETGKVGNIYLNEGETSGSLIFKKSLVDLFNFNFENKLTNDCDLNYEILKNDSSILHFKKNEHNCKKGFKLDGERAKKEKILNSIIERQLQTEYFVSNNILQNIVSIDEIKIYIEFNSNSFQRIKTELRLKLLSINPKKETIDLSGSKIEHPSIKNQISGLDSIINEFNFVQQDKLNAEEHFDKKIRSSISSKKAKTGKLQASKNFLFLIKSIRTYLSENEKLLKNTLENLIEKDKFGKAAIEVYIASESISALNNLVETFNINKLSEATENFYLDHKKSKQIEDILFASSLTDQNTIQLYKIVSSIFKYTNKILSNELKIKSALTLGNLASLLEGTSTEQSYLKLMTDNLEKCETIECKTIFLESLENSKLKKSFEILEAVLIKNCDVTSKGNLCYSILKSFNSFDTIHFQSSTQLFNRLLEIFHNHKNSYSMEIRIESLNILLDKYLQKIEETYMSNFLNILITLSKEKPNEHNKKSEFLYYSFKLIEEKIKNFENFNKLVLHLYSLNPKLKSVSFLVKGSSKVAINLIKSYSFGSLNSNLRQIMSNTNNSYLRSLDLGISYLEQVNKTLFDFIRFELETNNLDDLFSIEKGLLNKDTESSPATATLHLSVLGRKLLQNELFRGHSSLISLVWSLPTKLTSLFNTNFLVSDQSEYLVLTNGIVVRVETLGALSFDLSGLGRISAWSQLANIEIRANTGLIIEQKLTLVNDNKPIRTSQYDFGTDFSVGFNMNLNFGTSPMQTCIKMSNKKFYLREANKIYSTTNSKSLRLVDEMYKKLPLQAKTFMFDREAIKYC